MADSVVSSLVSPIMENLSLQAPKEVGLAWGLDYELENLKRNFTMVQAVLQDAEEKQWNSDAIKNWLRSLKDAAYDDDDVLTYMQLIHVETSSYSNGCSGRRKIISRAISSFNNKHMHQTCNLQLTSSARNSAAVRVC